MKLSENVVQMLKEQMWYLATCSDEPNAVPVAFKDVAEDGKLLVGDVFLDTTLANIKKNGKIAVSVSNGATLEGCQIKGTAVHVTEGPVVEAFKKVVSEMFKGAMTAKGALIITPEKVIVTTPGPDCGKVL
ncbi:MAG TPA: pyridoxamine 5'-phosphate oxidase family protein [Candidatus Acidoferrum sp.]|nr:pyridoxamine 5'-phosphate oxidase family protein [Candidatus Acidoferrum sp.]